MALWRNDQTRSLALTIWGHPELRRQLQQIARAAPTDWHASEALKGEIATRWIRITQEPAFAIFAGLTLDALRKVDPQEVAAFLRFQEAPALTTEIPILKDPFGQK